MATKQYSEHSQAQEAVKTPKADSELTNTLNSVERMLGLASSHEVLQNLLNILTVNDGVSQNPEQIKRLDALKTKIVAKMGGTVTENCDAGVTTAASIASIPNVISGKNGKKRKPIKRKMIGLDMMNFMECVDQDVPVSLFTSGHKIRNNVIGENSILSIDGRVYPSTNKKIIKECLTNLYQRFELPENLLCKGITPFDFVYLYENESTNVSVQEDETNNEVDAGKEQELKNNIGKDNIASVDEDETALNGTKIELKANQQLVDIDETDPNNKKYILKDPKTNKYSVKNGNEIDIQNEAFKYYPLAERIDEGD